MDVHINHENYLLRQAVELQPKVQLYVCSHMVYPCVIIDLHATLACQDSDSGVVAGVVACLLFCLLCTAS